MSPQREPSDQVTEPLAPAWTPVVGLVLAAAGLAVSGYLAVEHFTASTVLACPDRGVLNCVKVTTSEQSAVFGVPVTVLGLGYFLAMLLVSLPAQWRSPNPALRHGRLGLATIGVVFVGYLVYAELFILDAICLWCTAVHVLAIALFAVTAVGTAYADPRDLRRAAA